jgi:threonine aldolase
MLAGDSDFISLARVWQHRHGGRLVSIAPIALSARLGFERNAGRMRTYFDRAREIAAGIVTIDGLSIVPNPPQTNTFHIFLRGSATELEERAHAYARETGTFAFGRLAPTADPGVAKWEFVVGDATMELEPRDVLEAVRAIA